MKGLWTLAAVLVLIGALTTCVEPAGVDDPAGAGLGLGRWALEVTEEAGGDDVAGATDSSDVAIPPEPVLELGEVCGDGGECLSGFCVDGVCCDTACGDGVTEDCLVCSMEAGATADGSCEVAAAGALCRPSAGGCDLEEVCDGAAAECPADEVEEAGIVCQASDGPCDVTDTCDGASPLCPD
ncbi:MAG: hypothetical protein FJ098_08255 [Deltaproteobacteria bacterium]|nr:hypothetical protein [Deltaproteobacteria bacterium]